MSHLTLIAYSVLFISAVYVLCDDDSIDRDLVFDVNYKRTLMIDDVTKKFENITGQMVKVGQLIQSTGRKLRVLCMKLDDLSTSAEASFFSIFVILIVIPCAASGLIGLIICSFFQTELENLGVVLHTRWDVGDQPDIITKSKAPYRLANWAMPRLYHKVLRHRASRKLLPKQAPRDTEAYFKQKIELELPAVPEEPH